MATQERRGMVPESNITDWLTWPAQLLLDWGGVVASWFFNEDAVTFTVVQMMFATILLAAVLALIVFWQRVVELCRSIWRHRCTSARSQNRT